MPHAPNAPSITKTVASRSRPTGSCAQINSSRAMDPPSPTQTLTPNTSPPPSAASASIASASATASTTAQPPSPTLSPTLSTSSSTPPLSHAPYPHATRLTFASSLPPAALDREDEAFRAATISQTLDEEEAAAAISDHSDEEHSSPPRSPTHLTPDPTPDSAPAPALDDEKKSCVICFEREPNVTLDPCGHANLCDVCVSRLLKRRCPTCRARAKKATISAVDSHAITKNVRDIIQERKNRESQVLEDTLQIVFLGPEKVGKKTLVRKLISRYPLVNDASSVTEKPPSTAAADFDVFSDGTDFSANSSIAGAKVRLTVLRRTTLASRRMVLDDVRVLKPDVLVLCCSAHAGPTFDAILSWDKVLRNNFQKPRVWALLTLDGMADAPSMDIDTSRDVPSAIRAIAPPELRPRGHYICSPGEGFSIGFRSLAKDIVSMGRIARDEELAASIALEEARSLAEHEAAGTLGDQAAANLVIANNGIGVPTASSNSSAHASRAASGRGHGGVGRTFSLRGLRGDRGGNNNGNAGISISGFVNWLAGSHET